MASVNSPLARRMPGFDARHATRRARRTRRAALVVAGLAVAASLVYFLGLRPTHHPAAARRRAPRPAVVPRAVATLAPWHLAAPISRTVVVADPPSGGTRLVILGGATTGGLTAAGAFALDTTTGTLTQVGDLMTTLDDAAGAVLGGQDVVFGGTRSVSSPASASVQGLSGAAPGAATSGRAVPVSALLGTLPQPRAAAAAVTSGSTTYLVGGANALGADPEVLATTDGRQFVPVAALPVPVRFPAVAVYGGRLYVFGGVGGAGGPVDTIQVVDLKTHRVTDTRRLPEPLAGTAAVVLGHDILLAGGDTQSAAAAPSTGAPAPALSSVSIVWSFDPRSGVCTPVGSLPVAVSHAGVAVLGATAWLIGGESAGAPVSAVQSIVTAPVPAGAGR